MTTFEQFGLDFGREPSLTVDASAAVVDAVSDKRPGKPVTHSIRRPRGAALKVSATEVDLFGFAGAPVEVDTSDAQAIGITALTSESDDQAGVAVPDGSHPRAAMPETRKATPTITARPVNFAEALNLIETSGTFNAKQLAKLRSHVNVVAKALQKVNRNPDLTLLPCEPRLLRRALEGFHPAQARIKGDQWNSILSGLRRILRETGWLRPVERHRYRTPAWQGIVDSAAPNGPLEAIRNFANFCTEIGVEPADVSHATFDRYVDHLEIDSMTLNHCERVVSARQSWNRLCRDNPSLGIAPLPQRARYNLVATCKDDLSASFHASVRAYLDRCATPDPFDLDIGRALAPETLRKRETFIFLGAQYLLDAGWPLEQLDHIRAICTPEAIGAILREQFRRHSADGKAWPPGAKPMASHLRTMAAQVGELSDADLAQVQKLAGRVPKAKRGFPKTTRERLAAFDDERVLRDFVGLPRVLWRGAMGLAKSGKLRQARAKAKYAIALAILLTRPLRIGELASIDFATDFRRDRKGRIVGLYIPGERAKTGIPIEADIDPILGRRIAAFHERFIRPASRPGENYLFLADKSGHVAPNILSGGLKREIWRHLGITFNAHLARALVATIILDADPNGGPIAQRMLGHTHVDTTTRHYGMQRGRAAQRQYEAFLARTLRGRNS